VSGLLGRPFMAWQRHLADVALEVGADGRPWYRTVVVVVPRQQGKSTGLNAVMVDRALERRDRNIAYTAQDRSQAAERVVEQLFDRQLARGPLRRFARVRRTNGSERVTFTNGSRVIVVAPTDQAGHGFTLHAAVIDEAWAQTSMALPQAFGPAMITVADAQLWVVSTVGDGTDILLQHYQDLGRASLEDPTSRVAYLEWSAADDDDPADPATWARCMPALGVTITADAVAAELAADPVGFERAYLCRRPVHTEQTVIAAEVWAAAARPDDQLADPVVLAVDVNVDRSAAAIVACSRSATTPGAWVVDVVDTRPGVLWVTGRTLELIGRWHPRAVVVDSYGPAAGLLPELQRAGVPVQVTDTASMAAACAGFYDDVAAGHVHHLDQLELTAAVAGARRRPLGDRWVWARRAAVVDLAPLIAATLARWGAANGPVAPVVYAR
jgi:hypothetical protein